MTSRSDERECGVEIHPEVDRRRGRLASPIFSSDDRQIMMFDPDDEWWYVETRRGHGPHGASRRRACSPAERVRARPEVDLMVDRRRGGMVNAGAEQAHEQDPRLAA